MDKKSILLSMLRRLVLPGEVVSGAGSIRRLQALAAGKALVVASNSALQYGQVDKSLGLLDKGQVEGELLMVDAGEPTAQSAETVARRLAAIDADYLIAIGGGSVLDVAKVAWAILEHPDLDFSRPPPLVIPAFVGKLSLIAIPTTAGSGSEASQVAVLKDAESKCVMPYVSTEWIPQIVLLDPQLSVSLGAELTASTGMDALTHAIEAYTSRLSTPLIQAIAAAAVEQILRYLPTSQSQPDELESREGMLNGSFLAGLAQSAASTGIAHALTHAATQVLGTSHGRGNALFLMPAMSLNRKNDTTVYDRLAASLGLDAERFLADVGGLSDRLKLPSTLTELAGQKPTHEMLEALVDAAAADICMKTNPYKPAMEELNILLETIA